MNGMKILNEIKSLDEKYGDKFILLKNVSSIINQEGLEDFGRELVLRILDKRKFFDGYGEIIESMIRQVGLMPYMDEDSLGLKDSLAYEFFKPLHDDGDLVFHRAQAEVYYKLLNGESVILSAPTSFGKSKIVDSIIELNRHNNIAIIVPTIALIDETRRRLSRFSGLYKIITHITQEPGAKNIFIFTAERLISYEELPIINFFVLDEFYKIGALDKDEERTISLNQAFYRLLKMRGQFYLLGPNIRHIPENFEIDVRCNFFSTSFATVVSEVGFVNSENNELEALAKLLLSFDEQTLVYCKSPNRVNEVAHYLLDKVDKKYDSDALEASEWIGSEFHRDWIYPKALEHGISLHHGRLPRSIAQISVKLFNERKVKYLICTSTLIEGVNTSAKNIVIFDHKIGNKKYDFFTFNNIKGRGGRMFQYFIGNVYIFNAPPQEELPFVDFPYYSQGNDVPDSLLIQLDDVDLKQQSKDRLNKYFDQNILPVDIIKNNSAVDPDAQIKLASVIYSLSHSDTENLLWDSFPKYEQLKFCCDLIWEHFVSKDKAGVFSSSQLAFKLFSFLQNQNIKDRIFDELTPGKYAAESPDEAVERILDFDRNWAGYTFPRLLMVLDSIQRHVLIKKVGRSGNYAFFAASVENLFKKSSLIALEEFGLPLQIGMKIDARINISENIDLAITQLRGYSPDARAYTNFEINIITDVKEHI